MITKPWEWGNSFHPTLVRILAHDIVSATHGPCGGADWCAVCEWSMGHPDQGICSSCGFQFSLSIWQMKRLRADVAQAVYCERKKCRREAQRRNATKKKVQREMADELQATG